MLPCTYVQSPGGRSIRCPEGYPHAFCLLGKFPPDIDRMREWCKQQFGRGNEYRRWGYDDNYGTVYFRFPQDAFAFKMRWL